MKSISKKDFDLVAHTKDSDYEFVNIIIKRIFNGNDKVIMLNYKEENLKNVAVNRGLNHLKFVSHNGYNYVYMKINTSHLIGYSEPRRAIRITEDDFDTIYLKLCELIEQISQDIYYATGINLNIGNEFTINRIDYAVDIKTQFADEYIRLLKKGFIPKALKDADYSENLYYSNHSKRSKMRRVINCYNKSKFSEAKGIRAEKNILRFEVQLGLTQIEKILEMHFNSYYNDYKKGKYIYYLFEIAPFVLKQYYAKLVGTNDFYKKKEIEQKITELPLVKQSNIKKFLKEICRKNATLEKLKKQNKEAINDLCELGINPIPLKSTMSPSKLVNLYTYLDGTKKLNEKRLRNVKKGRRSDKRKETFNDK